MVTKMPPASQSSQWGHLVFRQNSKEVLKDQTEVTCKNKLSVWHFTIFLVLPHLT